ncbi:unnamed protein product [Citrullus colocynthis]|uniref:Uncharacterized protein n=1 Tax=Citrullus colocynthis TaxID=252529 RepID=A0ABP0YNW8_9ROSI
MSQEAPVELYGGAQAVQGEPCARMVVEINCENTKKLISQKLFEFCESVENDNWMMQKYYTFTSVLRFISLSLSLSWRIPLSFRALPSVSMENRTDEYAHMMFHN